MGAYFGEYGEEIAANPSIVCDICGADCWEESYLTKEEEDICPACYSSDKKMYAGAEHQKFGEPVPLVVKKREAPNSDGVAKKSKIAFFLEKKKKKKKKKS